MLLAGGVLCAVSLILGIMIGSNMTSASAPKTETTPELLAFSNSFAEIAERVNPSVVNITCTEKDSVVLDEPVINEEYDPHHHFGFGSGVIIESDGYILTSNHVIASATKIDVKLADNQKYQAKVVGQDDETDLALIRVEPKEPLHAAVLGDSDGIRPGQWVMAIGNPFVYDHTVTVGVISALHRKLGTTIYDNFIQTDAAINFGNSGGPLLNIKGEVIGINTLISSQGTGIGFSIPINTAKEIIPELKEKGKVSRGFLGLVPQDVTPELQKSLELPQRDGVLVASIQTGSPADKAGLRRYDLILELNGQKLDSEDQFRRLIAGTAPGRKLLLKVLRDKKSIVVEAQVMERPSTQSSVSEKAPP